MFIKIQVLFKEWKSLFLHYKLLHLVQKIIKIKPEIITLKDAIICFVFAKSIKTYKIILNLIKNGYSEDAEMLIRTLFDLYIITATIHEDKTDTATEMFYSFDSVTRAKMFNTLSKRENYKAMFEERRNNPKPDDIKVEEIERRADEWKKQFGKSQKWHGKKTMGELAEALNIKQYYETAYDLQSQFIHSLPRVMERYLKLEGEKIIMNVNPSKEFIDLPLVSSFNMMSLITDRVVQHFHLNFVEDIKKLAIEYNKSVKER